MWDKRFLALADHVAQWSKDRSTKVGAVIVNTNTHAVISMGYNGFCRGVNDNVEARHERPAKYLWSEHAERNAIYNSVHNVRGATIYSSWYPCADCGRAIIQTGIHRLVTREPDWDDARWGLDFRVMRSMFQEVGIVVTFIKE